MDFVAGWFGGKVFYKAVFSCLCCLGGRVRLRYVRHFSKRAGVCIEFELSERGRNELWTNLRRCGF